VDENFWGADMKTVFLSDRFLMMLVCLILIPCLGTASADPVMEYELGAKAYESEDLISAMGHLERAAESGHAKAMLLLGYIYDKAEENTLAMKYYRNAYEQGNAEAAMAIGTMYASGDGVERSQETARTWYEKAAAAGDVVALETLGLAYMNGDLGVQKNPQRGRELLRRAADNGHRPARDLLGSMDGDEAKTN